MTPLSPVSIWEDEPAANRVIGLVDAFFDEDPVTGHLQVTENRSEAEWMSVIWPDPVTGESEMREPYREGVTQMFIHKGALSVSRSAESSTAFLWKPLYWTEITPGVFRLVEDYPGKANIVPLTRTPEGHIRVGGSPSTEIVMMVETLDQSPNYGTFVEFA